MDGEDETGKKVGGLRERPSILGPYLYIQTFEAAHAVCSRPLQEYHMRLWTLQKEHRPETTIDGLCSRYRTFLTMIGSVSYLIESC